MLPPRFNRWKKRGLELCPGPAVGRAELALGPMPVLGHTERAARGEVGTLRSN